MAFITKVTWGAQGSSNFNQKAVELTTKGLTDGTINTVDGAVLRTWTTREAAQEWIDYINSIEPAPAEAELIEE